MSKLRNELAKLSGLIVGKNVLQSPLDFWGRYDAWREAVKGLESAIREMEDKLRNGCEGCSSIVHAHPEKVVAIVEKWSAENPVKTRQSEFLKLFPNAEFNTDGILTIAPCLVDKTFNMSAGSTEECCVKKDCIKCRKEYWLAEVE